MGKTGYPIHLLALCTGLLACQPAATTPPLVLPVTTATAKAVATSATPASPKATALTARISAEHMTQLVGRLARVVVRKLERGCKLELEEVVGKVDLLLLAPDQFRVDIHSSLTVAQASCLLGELGQSKRAVVAPLTGKGVRISSRTVTQPLANPTALMRRLDASTTQTNSVVAATLAADSQLKSALAKWNDDGIDLQLELDPVGARALAQWWNSARKQPAKQLARVSLSAQAATVTIKIAASELVADDVALALQLRRHVIEAFKIPSGAMMPSLLVGDHIFVDKTRLTPKRGAVMVFRFPENRDQDFIKRVVALPGDKLEVLDGRPIINGKLAPHCYVGRMDDEQGALHMYVEFLPGGAHLTAYNEKPTTAHCSSNADCSGDQVCRSQLCGVLQGPFVVAAAEAWVMGDSRDNSFDSRTWNQGLGAGVPFADFKGRAAIIWLSWGGDGPRAERFLHELDEPLMPTTEPLLASRLRECLRQRTRPTAPQRQHK